MEFSLFGGAQGAMFRIIPVIVAVGFFVVFGMIGFAVAKGLGQRRRNNHSPVLTVEARIVAKRTNVSGRHHRGAGANDMGYASSSTTYYATFEVQSGDRMELSVRDTEYGMLAEGDAGKLTFQGTRYLGFERGR